MPKSQLVFLIALLLSTSAIAQDRDSLPDLRDGVAPRDFDAMWAGFDPRAEPLETEIIPVSGAGYYYGIYTTQSFNVSSLLQKVSPEELQTAGARVSLRRSLMIEAFKKGWEKEWFSNKPETWPRATHKVYDAQWEAPYQGKLAFQVRCEKPNQLVVMIDEHAAVVDIDPSGDWQEFVLVRQDFHNLAGDSLSDWKNIRELKLSDAERLQPTRGETTLSRIVGKNWQGPDPEFRNLRWVTPSDGK